MSRMQDIGHSMLIVSSSDQFAIFVKKSLSSLLSVDVRKNASSARRAVMERYYDIIVINAPLPDETGEEFAQDAAGECSASVLIVVPSDVYDTAQDILTDQGILVLAKPLSQGHLSQAIRYVTAVQNRMRDYQAQIHCAYDKMEEMRIITKAKFFLVENRHISEDEAHRLIGKQAMNNGVSRKRIAEKIIEDYQE